MKETEKKIALDEFLEDCCDNGHYQEAEGALKFAHMIHLVDDRSYNSKIEELVRLNLGTDALYDR